MKEVAYNIKLVDGAARKSTVGLYGIQMSFTRRTTIMEVTIIYYDETLSLHDKFLCIVHFYQPRWVYKIL